MSIGPSDNSMLSVSVKSQKYSQSPCHLLFSDDGSFSASQSDPETTSRDDSSPNKKCAPSGKRFRATQDTLLVPGPSYLQLQSLRAHQVYGPLPPMGGHLFSYQHS